MTQIKVTTWANGDRDFASGRWVQLGAPTLLNFWLTGLPGGKIYRKSSFPWIRYESCDVEFDQHTTIYIATDRLKRPSGAGADGWIKSLFGQRIIK